MATPCGELPTPDDGKSINESIREQREEQERKEREYANATIRGKEIQVGDLKYRVIDDPQKIEKEVQKQKEDYQRQKEVRGEAQEKLSERRQSEMLTREGMVSREFQGPIGEYEATRVAMHALGLEALDFDKPRTGHGIDGFFRNPENGNLVVMEAKFTQEDSGFGKNSLDDTNHGRQMSVEWLQAKAREMQDRGIGSDLYTRANAAIGREIERVGAKNVERLLIHIHPQSLNVTASRPTTKGSWAPSVIFHPTMFDKD